MQGSFPNRACQRVQRAERRCLRANAGTMEPPPHALLIRFGGLADGDRVLDVGCGQGQPEFHSTEDCQRRRRDRHRLGRCLRELPPRPRRRDRRSERWGQAFEFFTGRHIDLLAAKVLDDALLSTTHFVSPTAQPGVA